MTHETLVKLFEHNVWANRLVIEACEALTDAQLDATPLSTSKWSIRQALTHLVESQRAYHALLTVPPGGQEEGSPTFAELKRIAEASGRGLLALARGDTETAETPLRSLEGYLVEPWVIMVQAINHATDHRRQITRMLGAVGSVPPRVDGWAFGDAVGGIAPAPA